MDLMSAIDQLMHEADVEAAPPWTGAPLAFTTDYYPPKELEAAWERWIFENGRFGCIGRSHMWHSDVTDGRMQLEHHDLTQFHADLCCDRWKHADRGTPRSELPPCSCVNVALTQLICATCQWHIITESEEAAVEAWHDHAFPGWRDLPVLPGQLRGKMGTSKMTPKLDAWFQEHYPAAFRVPGAPIRTWRQQYGTRHVAGYSPYGGYDLSAGIAEL